ncbi:MAG: rhomboid family intramembrane serine protease [Bacilli bacterium]|nr:rhomboid family intramembrane serine protease [Bacilli bacterium]
MEMTIIDDNELLVMKIIHYFIVNENYSPIVIKGITDEVWLENKNNSYSIIRIVTKHIHNEEQFNYDILKTKHIAKQIKRKTFDFSMNILSIFVDKNFYGEIKENNDSKFVNILINSEEEFKNNKYINDSYKNVNEKFKYDKNGFELISKITKDIGSKNIKENEKREKYMKNRKPIITYIIILINIIIFALMYIYGRGSTDTQTLIDFGANYVAKTIDGEYIRLITSAFLHIGLIHLILNMYSLFIVGSQVEYFYGKVKYVIVYIFSALMGSLFTVALSPENTVSAGASGAIFGLLGSILYFGYHYRGYIGNSIINQIIPIVILNLFIGFTTPGIGNAAHIGGLIGGYLISMAVGFDEENKSNKINGMIISILLTIFMIYIGFIA